MPGIAPRPEPARWRQGHRAELMWGIFAIGDIAAMILWPAWKAIPVHVLWFGLVLLYGFRVWPIRATLLVVGGLMLITGACLALGPFRGALLWSGLISVPLTAAMFLAMVWHARRHLEAQQVLGRRAEEHRTLLTTQERFTHDASHELRTPVTIARGHLELLRARIGNTPEIAVALDELRRIDAITERLLLLATIEQPHFVAPVELELEPVLEEVFMRWSEAAARTWRLGALPEGSLLADPDRLRVALDALIENAVKYTAPGTAIELSARRLGGDGISIEVRDEGRGVPPESLERIFGRFARADPARTRSAGGVGLGLAIVDAIVKAHGGSATVSNTANGCVFALQLPGFTPAPAPGHAPEAQMPGPGPWAPSGILEAAPRPALGSAGGDGRP